MTVRSLAEEADSDTDEVLLALWESGVEYPNEPKDRIRRRDMPAARAALGITEPNWRTVATHAKMMGVSEDELRTQLRDIGYSMDSTARKLPKGAAARLRKARRSREPDEALVEQEGKGATYELPAIGHEKCPLHQLSVNDVTQIFWYLVEHFAESNDPIAPAVILSKDLLESAVLRPQTSLFDVPKYKTVELAAAALMHSLALNHAFENGNKRVALVATLVMLRHNGLAVTASGDEALKLVVRVAAHRMARGGRLPSDQEVAAIAQWIVENSRSTQTGEKRVQFRTLKGILARFDCSFSHPRNGNRMDIDRVIKKERRFGRSRKLHVQVYYRNDGTEVEPNTMRHIRVELELDELHGHDFDAFYGKSDPIDEVIAQYQSTLVRLARI